MKITLLSLFVFLISLSCFAQSLEGEWKGIFTVTNPAPMSSLPNGGYVELKIILNEDSSYTVYSSSQGGDARIVCEVLYKRIGKDSIYLEETKVVKPEYQVVKCFQKMYLRIQQKKKSTELIGTFYFVRGSSCVILMPGTDFGDIRFYKKTEGK